MRTKLPPLTVEGFKRVVRALGYVQVAGTKHLAYEHPEKGGKVNLDEKWTGVKAGSWPFRSVVYDQLKISKKEFERVYWETR